MCSLINKQLLLTAYAYLFIMEQQKAQQRSEALQTQSTSQQQSTKYQIDGPNAEKQLESSGSKEVEEIKNPDDPFPSMYQCQASHELQASMDRGRFQLSSGTGNRVEVQPPQQRESKSPRFGGETLKKAKKSQLLLIKPEGNQPEGPGTPTKYKLPEIQGNQTEEQPVNLSEIKLALHFEGNLATTIVAQNKLLPTPVLRHQPHPDVKINDTSLLNTMQKDVTRRPADDEQGCTKRKACGKVCTKGTACAKGIRECAKGKQCTKKGGQCCATTARAVANFCGTIGVCLARCTPEMLAFICECLGVCCAGTAACLGACCEGAGACVEGCCGCFCACMTACCQ